MGRGGPALFALAVISLTSCPATVALAQDSPYLPRSSNPRGFSIDDPAIIQGRGGAMVGGGGAITTTGGGSGSGGAGVAPAGGAASGGVQLQGTTRLNATGRNLDSTAIGSGSQGCTRVGGIGECP